MSGILDSKSRVFDTIFTLEGRRQLALGGIDVKYVSFTDGATFYAGDIASGSADTTKRLYLEACNLPQDQITLKSDAHGRLTANPATDDFGVIVSNGKFVKTGFDPTLTGSASGIAFVSSVVSGTNIESYVDNLLALSIDSFSKNQTIATLDSVFDDEQFDIGNPNIEFVINDQSPLQKQEHVVTDDTLEEIFYDPRFSNQSNFMYLPPVNKLDESTPRDLSTISQFKLGDYKPLGYTQKLTHDDVLKEHAHYLLKGYQKKIRFDPSSRQNNVIIQGFESTQSSMNKLDIVDFGISNVLNSNGTTSSKHILFFGRILLKQNTNSHIFVHLFTMIFG